MAASAVVRAAASAASAASQPARSRHQWRRKSFAFVGPKFSVLAMGLVAAIALASYMGGDHEQQAPAHRQLGYAYEPGVCESYITDYSKYISMVLLMWGIFYMFWGLAIICDDYFVSSLEAICEQLKLSDDVAGATFMAAGSSAPELFTSVMAVFAVKNDVGIGTIVGSAVFNLCIIIGGTALFTPGTLTIDWKPITRDTLFYGISIVAMILVLKDGVVVLVEACTLILCYGMYVVFMYFNPAIMTKMDECCGKKGEAVESEDAKEEEEEDDEPSPFSKAVTQPLTTLFEFTIPNLASYADKKDASPPFLTAFFMSIIWIGVLSYWMVTWASKLGCIWNIHPAVMGVTILAAGTSVPDAIGSLIVAKQGKGDMAVSNAIGSNVFDILLGLGLPWLLHALIKGDGIPVDAENIVPMSMILFGTLVGMYLVIVMSGFKLNNTVGLIFFLMYFAFVAYNLMHEFNIISF